MDVHARGPVPLPPSAIVPQEHLQVHGFRPLVFHAVHCAEQMLYQCLSPFSTPLVYILRGHAAAVNMRFVLVKDNAAAVYFQIYLSASLFCAIGCIVALSLWLAVYPTPLSESQSDLFWCIAYETIFVAISAVFQRTAVAIKYAFMSARDYRAVMTTEQTYDVLTADQLIVGWSDLSASTIRREVALAGDALGLDPSAVQLQLPAVLARRLEQMQLEWKRRYAKAERAKGLNDDTARTEVAKETPAPPPPLLGPTPPMSLPAESVAIANPIWQGAGGSETASDTTRSLCATDVTGHKIAPAVSSAAASGISYQPGGIALVSADWLACALIAEGNADAIASLDAPVGWAAILLALVGSILPVAVRSAYGLPAMGDTPLGVAVLVNTWHSSIWYVFISLAYLKVGILDYKRRAKSLELLGKLSARYLAVAARNSALVSAEAGSRISSETIESSFRLAIAPSPRKSFAKPRSVTDASPRRASRSRLSSIGLTMNSFRLRSEPTMELAAGAEHISNSGSAPPRDGGGSARASIVGGYVEVDDDDEAQTDNNAPRVVVAPVLPLDSPGNAVAWLIVRRLLLGFGRRFHGRLQSYAGLALVLGVGVSAGVIVKLAVSGTTAATTANIGGGGAPLTAATVSLVVIALYSVVLLLLFVLGMLFYGAGANEAFRLHRGLLTARLSEARQAQAHWGRELTAAELITGTSGFKAAVSTYAPFCSESHDLTSPREDSSGGIDNANALLKPRLTSTVQVAACKAGVTHWADTASAIECAIAGVSSDELLSPVRIIGIPATWNLVRTLAVSGGSIVWAIVQLLQNKL